MWVSFINSKKIAKQSPAFCFLLFFSMVADSSADASQASVHKQTISLHEAIINTIKHNPDLRVIDDQIKVQQGRELQASVAPSPELIFQLEDVMGTGTSKTIQRAQATLSISWVLERGVRQRYINAARASTSQIKAESDVKQLDAAAETARRYLVCLAYQSRGIIADKTVQLAQETILSVRKRVVAGKTPKAELSRAEAELARTKLQREDIAHRLLAANHRLAAQWEETALTFTEVDGDITQFSHIATFEKLKLQLSQNPQFTQLRSNQLLKKAELELARARDKPNWHFNAGIRQLNSSGDQAFVAGFSIPFGERTRNPGRIAAARANLDKTHSEEIAVRTRLETVLYVMHSQMQHSLHVISKLRGDIIPPLEQALIETRRAYNLGRYSYLELRSVQAELLGAHNALLEASIDAHRNIIEIERLTGVRMTKPVSLLRKKHEASDE